MSAEWRYRLKKAAKNPQITDNKCRGCMIRNNSKIMPEEQKQAMIQRLRAAHPERFVERKVTIVDESEEEDEAEDEEVDEIEEDEIEADEIEADEIEGEEDIVSHQNANTKQHEMQQLNKRNEENPEGAPSGELVSTDKSTNSEAGGSMAVENSIADRVKKRRAVEASQGAKRPRYEEYDY
ncbi:unnamed protein product [Rhizoctonia solani]|uniref:Uncharacterized protein n=1 Tax=Rhizoctonia solani TaxID=456999 RepID=A0A8H3BKF0_9AGAM|nr:unnamed protein product [Rhizoctonia solani]